MRRGRGVLYASAVSQLLDPLGHKPFHVSDHAVERNLAPIVIGGVIHGVLHGGALDRLDHVHGENAVLALGIFHCLFVAARGGHREDHVLLELADSGLGVAGQAAGVVFGLDSAAVAGIQQGQLAAWYVGQRAEVGPGNAMLIVGRANVRETGIVADEIVLLAALVGHAVSGQKQKHQIVRQGVAEVGFQFRQNGLKVLCRHRGAAEEYRLADIVYGGHAPPCHIDYGLGIAAAAVEVGDVVVGVIVDGHGQKQQTGLFMFSIGSLLLVQASLHQHRAGLRGLGIGAGHHLDQVGAVAGQPHVPGERPRLPLVGLFLLEEPPPRGDHAVGEHPCLVQFANRGHPDRGRYRRGSFIERCSGLGRQDFHVRCGNNLCRQRLL